MASPAPDFGHPDCGLDDDLLDDGTLLVTFAVADAEGPLCESNSLIVSLTRDFLALALVGAADGTGISCPLILADLTGLGLLPSFASSRFGREIGLGIIDFPALFDLELNVLLL
jgi:hypothetical protein